MTDKKTADVGLDELLEIQKRQTLFATVEAVPEKSNAVKVTPWYPGRGCACGSSLVVDKKSIKKLTRTGRRHFCCGKLLSVVEIEIDVDAVMPLHEVFVLLARRAATKTRLRRRRVKRKFRRGVGPIRAYLDTVLPIEKTTGGDGDGDGGNDYHGGGDDGGDSDGGDSDGGDSDGGDDDGGDDGSANAGGGTSNSQCISEKKAACISQFEAITKHPANASQLQFCQEWAEDECKQPAGST